MTSNARRNLGEEKLAGDIFDPIFAPDLVGRLLDNADRRNLRKVSKRFNKGVFDNMQCVDVPELQPELRAMRSEPEPCKNTAKVIYNPEKGIQRAIMCAIMSTGQLHVYVKTEHLDPFLASESVKCFDRNYKLELTLLYPKAQQKPPSQPNLYCRGGFRALALTCVDATELEAMRQSESLECKKTRVWYNPEENVQHAIMCAIISVDQELHVYVNQEHLTDFLPSESVKCFDKNYKLRLTLLYPRAQRDPPPRGRLRCAGGFRALKGGLAIDGRLSRGQEGVQVVRFTGNTHVAEKAFWGNQSLIELLDVNTIQEIHDNAFDSCDRLREVGDMPALRTIGDRAFRYTRLTQLGDMPSLTTIGVGAFEGTKLTNVSNMPALTTIGVRAFYGTPLTNLDMRALTTIGDGAFRGTKLTHLNMPALTTIGVSAFYGTPLTNLDMRALTTIGDSAFRGTKLTHLNMPALKTIGPRAFERTPLTNLGDMTNLTTIGYGAFAGTQLTNVNMPTLEEIGMGAFQDNTQLTNVHMPALKEIGDRAFWGTPLQELGDMPKLTTIGHGAFIGTQLTNVNMRALKEIGVSAFYDTPLTQLVNMPELGKIAYRAFQGCTDLETVHLPKTLKDVGFDAFDGCPLGQLSVEPGAEFVCECTSLASKLQALDNVHVESLTSGVQISTV